MPAVVTLAQPSVALEPSYQAFLDELRAQGETVWPGRVRADDEDAAAFVARLRALDEGAALGGFVAPGAAGPGPLPTGDAERPPQSVWWGVVDDVVVGVIVVRHHLTERLRTYGGHVSYEVRPSWRRRGVATAMVAAVLSTPLARQIGTLIATTADNNAASRGVIERCGGVVRDSVFVDEVQRQTIIYALSAR